VLVDLELNPGTAEWPLLLEATLAAEESGCAGIWVFDHLAGASLRGDRMLECCTLLGALAVSTRRVALGTLVANVWNREPGVLAVAAATAVELSGGRDVLLGLGAGTSPSSPFAAEQHAIGATVAPTVAERHARVTRTLDVIDRLWADVHDRDAVVATFLLPRPRPRTVIGVNSAALARLAGERADGVNVRWRADDAVELLRVAADAVPAGRPFLRTAYVLWDEALLDPDHPERRRMADAGVERVVLAELDRPDPDRIAAAFARHAG
jgi:alkanesulfonate monooxygenase SsuD/methylene tetrahydromethanopterin reductase-like flavin-dependent oxidoreductase (luciferase family)